MEAAAVGDLPLIRTPKMWPPHFTGPKGGVHCVEKSNSPGVGHSSSIKMAVEIL